MTGSPDSHTPLAQASAVHLKLGVAYVSPFLHVMASNCICELPVNV